MQTKLKALLAAALLASGAAQAQNADFIADMESTASYYGASHRVAACVLVAAATDNLIAYRKATSVSNQRSVQLYAAALRVTKDYVGQAAFDRIVWNLERYPLDEVSTVTRQQCIAETSPYLLAD